MSAFDQCEKAVFITHKCLRNSTLRRGISAFGCWSVSLLLQFLDTYQHSINICDMILVIINTY